MSDERPKPKAHHVLSAASITVAAPTLEAAVLRVNRPEELAPALAQRDKKVVIENEDMQRRFAAFVRWEQAARWWLIPLLITWLLNQAIVRDYGIEASWRYVWKVEQTFEGKVTLTPSNPPASNPTPLNPRLIYLLSFHQRFTLSTVAPRRRPNADLRTREHLTEAEVERLMEAAKRKRVSRAGKQTEPSSRGKRRGGKSAPRR